MVVEKDEDSGDAAVGRAVGRSLSGREVSLDDNLLHGNSGKGWKRGCGTQVAPDELLSGLTIPQST